jgi:integrase
MVKFKKVTPKNSMPKKVTPKIQFDANYIKSLPFGEVVKFDDYPGLRLEITKKYRTWIYRYKSPVDLRMRQIKVGRWPAMSFPLAIVTWETLKNQRDSDKDPVLDAKRVKSEAKALVLKQEVTNSLNAYTVRVLCDEYLEGHIYRQRAKKGATEITRMFNTMLGDIADLPSSAITRAIAFDLIQKYVAIAPVQAGKLRCELGAAWDFAMDAGRLPESAANWWRLILRGKVRSKGKTIEGKKIGVIKRVLTDEEIGELIAWLPNFSPIITDVLTVYLWTGTRGAEIVGMSGSEVSEEAGQVWWTIPKNRTKNARHDTATDQRVPLFGKSLSVVLRRKKLYGNGFLFPTRLKTGHIEQKYITEQVFYRQPYCKIRPEQERARLTVTHWAPHDLRRTSRTLLAKLGCPDAVGESILGHMLPGVVGTYNRHQYDDEKCIWLFNLSEHLELLAKRYEL